MEKLKISRPEKAEELEINTFFQLVLEDTFRKNNLWEMEALLKEEVEDKQRILKQDFDSDGEKRYFLLARIGGKIVGTIEYGLANDLISTCTQNELSHLMEIGTVFVHPKFQGSGIGRKLLDEILKRMRARGLQEFCLDSGYPMAQKIWLHVFGKPLYHLQDYWGENADHMIWRVPLK